MASPTADPSTASSSTPAQSQAPSIEPFKVYKPPAASSTSPTPLPALPDDYFTPTMSDLKAAQATLSARTSQLVNAPLQLRAVRDAAEKTKRDRWPEVSDGVASVYWILIGWHHADQDPCQVPRPNAARKDVPLHGQNQERLRVRTELLERPSQAYQVHPLCVIYPIPVIIDPC